jgi:hypothetical protein
VSGDTRAADVQAERRSAASEIAAAIEDFLHGQSSLEALDAARDRIASALDHYIARSAQGWVR